MASSSTRSTHLEHHLRTQYRIAFVRLHSSHMLHHANFLTLQFAAILDIDQDDLFRTCLLPDDVLHHGDGGGGVLRFHKIAAERKALDELEEANWKMRRCDKIASASSALADTAAALGSVGRGREAGRFCEWGEALWHEAQAAHADEQRRETFWRSNAQDEVDMT